MHELSRWLAEVPFLCHLDTANRQVLKTKISKIILEFQIISKTSEFICFLWKIWLYTSFFLKRPKKSLKNLPFSNVKTRVRFFFQIWWPSHNILTLICLELTWNIVAVPMGVQNSLPNMNSNLVDSVINASHSIKGRRPLIMAMQVMEF